MSELQASKRLVYLERLAGSGSNDPMVLYGLAMELRTLKRFDDARGAFEKLRDAHPGYVAMYLMCGQMLATTGDTAQARAWFEEGIRQAKASGNAHALGELEAALAEVSG